MSNQTANEQLKLDNPNFICTSVAQTWFVHSLKEQWVDSVFLRPELNSSTVDMWMCWWAVPTITLLMCLG